MKTVPILLIHGFNGAPSNWTGPSDRLPDFLAAHGFDPELIRVFSFGFDTYQGKRTYNNLGDMRQIAHRLDDPKGEDAQDCSVDRLSQASVERGGSSKVTIIAHSSGGLIARYYMTRREEDEFGTRYRDNVGRVIFLGTPHHGVDIEDVLDPLPTNRLIYRLMVRAHYLLPPEYREQSKLLGDQVSEMRRVTRTAFLGESSSGESIAETPAFKQMHPESPFLQDINRPGAMPPDPEYCNIIGDIRANVRITALGRNFVDGEKSFGDFLVSAKSSSSIPNARSQCHALAYELCLDVDLGHRTSHLLQLEHAETSQIPIHRHLRSLPAARAKMLEALQAADLRY
jgi:pimeloyl-ACP methyl ester carboxylesterase